jgi:hypothetical protein
MALTSAVADSAPEHRTKVLVELVRQLSRITDGRQKKECFATLLHFSNETPWQHREPVVNALHVAADRMDNGAREDMKLHAARFQRQRAAG